MERLRRLSLAVAAAFTLSACAGYQLQDAKSTQPGDSAFLKGLHQGYLDLSGGEYKEGDYGASDAFAMRAMSTGGDNPVGPEAIAARTLPAGTEGDLTAARDRLVAALDKGADEKIPDQAAHAQVMFDCWMEEQEENIQPDDIARCRAMFMDAMTKVDAALKPKMVMKAPEPAPKPAPKPMPAPMKMPGPYTVFFEFDSAAVDVTAGEVLARVAADYAEAKPSEVVLKGHADRAGKVNYNMKLSQARLDSVVQALAAAGIPEDSLNTVPFGEDKPLVQTTDGTRSAPNRRVEITFLK